ncbi:helix-turn-helix domain-containing protein [Nostoc sp.]|uniref:helix-turn-helix domain-containing protein n=1 Tax=Nostoc sp. TaxID=1180 RepID=UPI002FFB25C2
MLAVSKLTEYPPSATLKRIRMQKNLTQSELAVMLIQSGHNISSIFISKFESGHSKPWPAARKAIACVLEMSEDELFPEI